MFKPRRFAGGNFAEDYLSWTASVETCIWNNRLPKSERLFLAVSSLRGEARRWWETYESRRWAKGKPVTTWEELQNIMDKRYIPKDFPEDIKERYGRRPARKKVLPASLLTLTDEQREAIVSGVIEGLRSYPELFQFDDPITSKESELREIQEDNKQMIPATPLSTIAAIEENKEKDQQLVVLCEENQQLEELNQEEEFQVVSVPIHDQNVVEEAKIIGVESVHEKEHTMIETGGNHGLTLRFDKLKPVLWIKCSLVEHLRHVKGLPHFVFEPGGNMIINKFVSQEILDLRTNPFKGGGNDANRVSCLKNRFDVGAFEGAYLSNQKKLGNKTNCSGKLTQRSIFTNWFHHNDIKGLRVMNFAIWVIQDFRRTDMLSLRRSLRPNQKVLGYDSRCFRFSRRQGTMSKWNHLKRRWDELVMNFQSQKTFSSYVKPERVNSRTNHPRKSRTLFQPYFPINMSVLGVQNIQENISLTFWIKSQRGIV